MIRPGQLPLRPLPVLLALAALACAPSTPADAGPYFPPPGEAWERRAPEEVGMDPDLVAQAVEYALSNDSRVVAYDFAGHEEEFGELAGPLPEERGGPAGLILRNGYIVAEWGDTDRPDLTFSVTKSFVSTMTGIAYDRGLIESTRDPVGNYVRDGRFDSPHNAAITWEILLQQTSEWEGELFGMADTADFYHRRGRDLPRQPPGTYYEYNDVRVNLASYATLMVLRRPLPEIMKASIMDPIGATDDWIWHGYRTSDVEIDGEVMNSVAGGGHWGAGLWIGARDMARFGHLFLREGVWNGERLLSKEWIDLATTPSELRRDYGYMWWLTPGEDHLPGTPVSTFAARGYGSNVIWVDRTHDLVVVLRWFGGRNDDFYGPLLESLVPAEAAEVPEPGGP